MAKSRKNTGTSKTPRKRKQGDKSVHAGRLEQVENLLATGMRSTDVARTIQATLDVSKRTAERYIARVLDKWAAEEPEHRARRRSEMEERLMRRLRMASGEVETPTTVKVIVHDEIDPETNQRVIEKVTTTVLKVDHAEATRIEDRLAKLYDLDAPTRLEHSGDVDLKVSREVEQIVKRLADHDG